MDKIKKAFGLLFKSFKKINKKDIPIWIFVNGTLALFSFIMLFQFVWMLLASFKSAFEFQNNFSKLFPNKWIIDNFVVLFKDIPILKGFLNTMIIEVSVITVGTIVSSLAAFSFAKLKLRHKTFWLLLLLSGMTVPYATLLLPQYFVYDKIGWINTLYPLIVPGLFGNTTMMFFLIQYLKGIPDAYFEAAKIDGCGYLKMHFKIAMPLMAPALSAQIIFWFIGIWNDYFAPSIYLQNYEVMTLQPMLARIYMDYGGNVNFPIVFASAVVSCVPMVIIYFVFQNYFVESMAITGIKE
jgi:multiple sugar transport system permease protein